MSKFLFLYTEPTGSGQVIGQTPHGIYDTDSEYQTDSLTVCKYVASKLGHPVMQLEFNSGSMYACFEEAVSEYSQQINHYNTKNWMWEHYGNTATTTGMSSTGSHAPETAVGGLAEIHNNNLKLKAQLFSDIGEDDFNYELTGKDTDASSIGKAVGEKLLSLAGEKFKKK